MHFTLDPDIEISSETVLMENAVFVPPNRNRNWVVEASIYDENGAMCEPAICWHYPGNRASVDIALPPDGAITPLKGTYIFGGVYNPHFGHFLCESTARLWALDAVKEPIDGILFFPMTLDTQEQAKKDFGAYSEIIGKPLPFILPEKPMRVEKLYIPKQGFGAGDLMYGSPEYRAFVSKYFGRSIVGKGIDKIYISKTRFNRRRGSILGEDILEEYLRDEGYTIFHPQDHSIEEQVAYYKTATHIIGPDGSPFHLVAMLANPDQHVAIIQRRPSKEFQMLARHLEIFGVGNILKVRGERLGWSPGGIRRVGLSVSGTVNFNALYEQLYANGYITGKTPWSEFSPAKVEELAMALAEHLGCDMYETTNPNQSLKHLPERTDKNSLKVVRLGDYPMPV